MYLHKIRIIFVSNGIDDFIIHSSIHLQRYLPYLLSKSFDIFRIENKRTSKVILVFNFYHLHSKS